MPNRLCARELRDTSLCVDFCHLNAVPVKDLYPILSMDKCIVYLGDARVFYAGVLIGVI